MPRPKKKSPPNNHKWTQITQVKPCEPHTNRINRDNKSMGNEKSQQTEMARSKLGETEKYRGGN